MRVGLKTGLWLGFGALVALGGCAGTSTTASMSATELGGSSGTHPGSGGRAAVSPPASNGGGGAPDTDVGVAGDPADGADPQPVDGNLPAIDLGADRGDPVVDATLGADTAEPDAAPPPPSSYDPCPPKGKACVLMPLGDSLTAGAGSSGGGYRVELFRQAVAHGKSFTTVGSGANGPAELDGVPFPRRHEGHGGFTIDGISTWITDHTTITTYKPDIVLLSIGTNGLKYATSDVPGQLRALGALMDQILAADSHLLLVVAQIIPMNTEIGSKNVVAYNAGIPALIKARLAAGKHVGIANIYAGFVANPKYKTEYLPNGLHPVDAGYAAMGRAWYGALGPLLR